MANVTSKNRRKSLQQAMQKRNEYEAWNSDEVSVGTLKEIENKIKDPQKVLTYLTACANSL